jgi:hypothetical protein
MVRTRIDLIFLYIAERNKYIPGPGAYQPKLFLDPNGKYFVSNLRSTLGTSFGGPSANSPRFEKNRGNKTPGPGSYQY